MSKVKLGAQLYTVRDYCKTIPDIAETFRKIKKIGYTSVQISGFGPVDYREVAKVVQDSGLIVSCTHIPFQRLLDETDDVINQHNLWKCKHPAIGGLPGDYFTLDGIKRFLDELARVSPRLTAEGMDFSYHNHSHELMKIGKKTWLETLYEMADPKMLKAEIDTYWITHGGGDPAAWIRKCAWREPLVHFKDMVVGPDRTQRMAEIGEGNLNWNAILEAVSESGVEWALVEQDNCYERNPFESLEISFKNLKAMGLS